jgi:hypothetical protein
MAEEVTPAVAFPAAHEEVAVQEAEHVKEDLTGAGEIEKPDLGPSKPAEELVESGAKEDMLASTAGEEAAEQMVHDEEHHEELHESEPPAEKASVAHEEAAVEEPEDKHVEEEKPVAPEIPDSNIAPGGFSTQPEPTGEPKSIETAASPNAEPEADEEEAEEAARKARIAERMKKVSTD